MTPQQEAIASAATALLALLDAVVPDNVAHYAVEGAIHNVKHLRRKASTVHTYDTRGDRA